MDKITISIAKDEQDKVHAYELRKKVYCLEYGHLNPDSYPDGLEKDVWDAHSVHFIATDSNSEVIGTVRLILDSAIGYQTEKYVNLPDVSRSRLAEVSRLTMRSDFRGHGQHVIFGLSKAMYEYSIENGITHWFATMFIPTWRLFLDFGIYFQIIGEPSFWPSKEHGQPVIPVFLELSGAGNYLLHRNPELYGFIFGNDIPANNPSGIDEILQKVRNDLVIVRNHRKNK